MEKVIRVFNSFEEADEADPDTIDLSAPNSGSNSCSSCTSATMAIPEDWKEFIELLDRERMICLPSWEPMRFECQHPRLTQDIDFFVRSAETAKGSWPRFKRSVSPL